MHIPHRPLWTALVLGLLIIHSTGVALAQDAALESELRALGLAEPQVTIAEDEVLVEYRQAVSEFGPVDAELERLAQLLDLVGRHVIPERPVRIRQLFDDGQIMELVALPSVGRAYVEGDLSLEAFQEGLVYQPRTRGPLLVPGVCRPQIGDTCQNATACACYPTDTCAPGDPAADPRGCVMAAVPNAKRVGDQLVCNPGFGWNEGLDACVPLTVCPPGLAAEGDQCRPLGVQTSVQPPVRSTEPLGWLSGSWVLIPGLACCGGLLLLLVVVVWLLLRRRRSRTLAPAAAPPPVAPPPPFRVPRPQRPAAFDQAERAFADLDARYRAGGLTQEAYRASLAELTVRDAGGEYWAYGPAGWHWHDGQRWVKREPPAEWGGPSGP
jgi:hypothetical protein